jgi:hypothetical protein
MPYEDYAAIPAIRASHLAEGWVNGETTAWDASRVLAAIEGRLGGDTDARRFGRGAHVYLLEGPSSYGERFRTATPCAATKADGERCGNQSRFYQDDGDKWFCGVKGHRPATAVEITDRLSDRELAHVEGLARSAKDHPALSLLRGVGWTELSIVWERDGLPVKDRFDRVTPAGTYLDNLGREHPRPVTIWDLKTVGSGKLGYGDLQKAITDYWYDGRSGLYRQGWAALHDGEVPAFGWIFGEKAEPYGLRAIRGDNDLLDIGWLKADFAWGRYVECRQTDHWPGIGETLERLGPKTWELKRYGEAIDLYRAQKGIK